MFISIPGEQAKTQVYAYKDRPQICKKCTKFYHGEKYCAEETRCAKCSEEGHRADSCNANPMNCPHYSGDHMAGNKNCTEFRKQEEVLAIQSNERVSRQQALAIYMRNNPNPNMNFAGAVAGQPPPPTKTPTSKLGLAGREVKTPVDKRKINNPPGVKTKTDTPPTNTTETAATAVRHKAEPKTIEILCQSPNTLRTYKRTIENPRRASSPFDEHDLTSEDNPGVRAEAKRLFQEYDSDDMEDDARNPYQQTKRSKHQPPV